MNEPNQNEQVPFTEERLAGPAPLSLEDEPAVDQVVKVDLTPARVVEVEVLPKEFRLSISSGNETATQHLGFSLTPTGVELDESQTPAQYRAGLSFFKFAQDRIKISFSEYVRLGKLKHGREVVEAGLQQLEFDMPSVKAAVDIASVPPELRNEFLTAEHYVVLARADITPKQRVKWARVATEQHLAPAQLKASIAAGEVVPKSVADKNTHGIINIQGLRAEYDIWYRRVGEFEGIRAMDVKCQQEIISELSEIAFLHARLTNTPVEQIPLPEPKPKAKAKKAVKASPSAGSFTKKAKAKKAKK